MNAKPRLVRLPSAIRFLGLSLAMVGLFPVTGAASNPESWQPQPPLTLTGQVQWAKYFSGSNDFNWNGTVAFSFDVARYDRLSLAFHGEIETIIERSQSFWNFEPQEVHFVLVPSLRMRMDRWVFAVVYDHHSRHDSDRFDGFTERWNTLMLRGEVASGALPFQIALAGGKIINDTDTDYDWEGRLEGEALLNHRRVGQPYGSALLRAVKTQNSPSGRTGFLDVYAELGLRFRGAHGDVAFFGSYHRRHDTDHFDGRTESLSLWGVRFEF